MPLAQKRASILGFNTEGMGNNGGRLSIGLPMDYPVRDPFAYDHPYDRPQIPNVNGGGFSLRNRPDIVVPNTAAGRSGY